MKKYSKLVKGFLFGLVALSLLGMLFLPSFQQKTAASQNTHAEFITRVSQGLGETQISNTDPSVAINSLSNLMEIRSGITVSSLVRRELINQQTATMNGKQPFINYDRFIDILTDTALQQASNLTDTDINKIVTTARGFTAPDMAQKPQNKYMGIFPGYYTDLSDEEAAKQIKAVANPQAQLLVRASIRGQIENQVRMYLPKYAMAAPSVFTQSWDLTNNTVGKGLTPVNAMLLTYTLVSGDSFADTTSTLTTTMQKIQQVMMKTYGSYPSYAGHSPYGANGYVFSSAAALFFTENNQMLLLSKFAGKQ